MPAKNKQISSTENNCLFVDETASIATSETVCKPVLTAKPAQLNIQLDNREHELIRLIPTVSKPRALHVGDIWIGLSGEEPAQGGLIIERKTWADLEASIMDGRYREQRGRLLAYSQETGARVAYIIEKSTLRNWTQDTVRKFIMRLQLVHGIAVFETASTQDTAAFVKSLTASWETDSTAFTAVQTAQRAADSIHVVKRDNDNNPRLFALKVLCLCPGVSTNIADVILTAADNSLESIMTKTIEDFSGLKIQTSTGKQRAIGTKVAERLYNLLHNK
jgi:ERCC4-type nuclease